MLRRFLSLVCVMLFVFSIFGVNARASEEREMIDGSYLTYEEESVGEATLLTRGVYLMAGSSKVSKAGSGVINAGGNTSAKRTVDEVGIAVMVERCRSGATSWSYYTSWQAERYNDSYIATSKRFTVTKGYYYRVRSTHWANSDASSSFTSGVYID